MNSLLECRETECRWTDGTKEDQIKGNSMEAFLIVCPLVFLAGFIDSIAGGGGLISLPAYLIAGVPPHVALGTGKLSSFPGAVVAVVRFAKNGYIRWKLALTCSAAALIGSTLGASITLRVDEKIVEKMMIVVLPIIAFYVLRNKNMGEDTGEKEISAKRTLIVGLAAAFVIGMYNGFYGPGTGTFLILVFTGVVKMNVKEAAGISKVINLASDVAAFVTFLHGGKAYIALGLTAALFSMAGSYFGSGLVVNNGQKIVRPVVIVVLGILFVRILMG